MAIISCTFTLAAVNPQCIRPPPPSGEVPTVEDCQQLLRYLLTNMRDFGDPVLTFALVPRAGSFDYRLPQTIVSPQPGNSCSMFVDANPAIPGVTGDSAKISVLLSLALDVLEKCVTPRAPSRQFPRYRAPTTGYNFLKPNNYLRIWLVRSREIPSNENNTSAISTADDFLTSRVSDATRSRQSLTVSSGAAVQGSNTLTGAATE